MKRRPLVFGERHKRQKYPLNSFRMNNLQNRWDKEKPPRVIIISEGLVLGPCYITGGLFPAHINKAGPYGSAIAVATAIAGFPCRESIETLTML